MAADARPGGEHAAGPARDRDLVALVAIVLSLPYMYTLRLLCVGFS